MVSLYMFLHCINLDYPNLTCQLHPCMEVVSVSVDCMQTMKSSDLSAKDFFQMTVNALLELCTHCVDGHRIVSIEGRLLLTLDSGDQVQLNILQHNVRNLLNPTEDGDINAVSSVSLSSLY